MSEINEVMQNQEEQKEFKRDFVPLRYCVHKVCKSCGRMFTMSDNDVVYFVQKFGKIPMRCPACRERRRTQSEENTATEVKE